MNEGALATLRTINNICSETMREAQKLFDVNPASYEALSLMLSLNLTFAERIKEIHLLAASQLIDEGEEVK